MVALGLVTLVWLAAAVARSWPTTTAAPEALSAVGAVALPMAELPDGVSPFQPLDDQDDDETTPQDQGGDDHAS
jgi:hypothetical protein